MDLMTDRRPSKVSTKGAWTERYLDRFYRSRPGWIDGTTLFHSLCKRYIRKGARVCELGSGASNSTTRFLSMFPGATLVGIDVDPRVIQNHFVSQAIVYDGQAFPFLASSFDAVVADYVHEHLPDPYTVCREVHRVLSDGGVLIFRTPNAYHYVPAIARITPYWFHRLVANRLRGVPADQSMPHPTFYRFNTARTIRRMLHAAGFSIIRLAFIESNPSYGMASRLLFLLFMGYERMVNVSPRLSWLRSNILCVAIKPGQPNLTRTPASVDRGSW